MKKISVLLTAIVLLMTILIAGGCGPENNGDDSKEPLKKVVILVKIDKDSDKQHLQLYESGKPESIEIDYLHEVEVDPGTKVVWRRAPDSGIKKFTKIGPVEEGEIFPQDASTILLNKRYRHRVPDKDITANTKQKYDITYIPKGEDEEKSVDPYLRIRGTALSTPGRP